MKYEEFVNAVDEIIRETGADFYVSPDFQCDHSEGYPVSLCASWTKCKAWLEPNEMILENDADIQSARQACADFGIRNCFDRDDFNAILKTLGEDAFQNACIPTEDEGMVM